MIHRTGSALHSCTGSGERAPEALAQALASQWQASYEHALSVARTTQEETFVSVMEREHAQLGRAPTLQELKSALAGTTLNGLSKDRLSQIKRSLVGRMPEGTTPIAFTQDRPLFRYLERVRAEYERFVGQHKQPPSFTELKALLAGSGIPITETSLRNILKSLRKSSKSAGESFKLSRYRIPVTTSHIEVAYNQAAEYLKRTGITKAPTAALVAKFLRQAGHPLSRDTLEHRFANVPELQSFRVSSYFDPNDKIVVRAHKRLRTALGRDPTTKELTSEYNKFSLQRSRPDNVWMRVSRLNKKLPAGRRMSFSDTFGSGIYDVDLQRVADATTKRLGRPPTLKELRNDLVSSVRGSEISLDATHRRCRQLGIPLTSEHDLTKQAQVLIAQKIQQLLVLFGRRPFGAEVREALRRDDGITLSQQEFNTTLGSAKRYRGRNFRTAVRLGFPIHLAGKLRKEYDALCRSTDGYPDAEQLAKRLGWKTAGVESALQVAQARAVRFRAPPIVLSNTPTGAALEAIRAIVLEIGASLAGKEPSETPISRNEIETIQSMANGWDLPELLVSVPSSSLTVDQKLARCEQWWVLITCLHAPPISVEEECELEARYFEARRAKALGVRNLNENPFEGFVQVLRVAKESGRLSGEDLARIMKQVEGSSSIAAAYGLLRDELMRLARQCGFPSIKYKPQVLDRRRERPASPSRSWYNSP